MLNISSQIICKSAIGQKIWTENPWVEKSGCRWWRVYLVSVAWEFTCEFWHPCCHVMSRIQHLFWLWCVSVGESLVRGTRCVHEVLEETHAEVRRRRSSCLTALCSPCFVDLEPPHCCVTAETSTPECNATLQTSINRNNFQICDPSASSFLCHVAPKPLSAEISLSCIVCWLILNSWAIVSVRWYISGNSLGLKQTRENKHPGATCGAQL